MLTAVSEHLKCRPQLLVAQMPVPSGQGRPRLPEPDIYCLASLTLALSRQAGRREHGESGGRVLAWL